MEIKKRKNVLITGPVTPDFITRSIASHSAKQNIGAHSIFLGQVRSDVKDGGSVTAIEYSAYEEMAEETFYEIREAAFHKFNLICMHIYHSLGVVNSGEISMFVFTSSQHRSDAIEACNYIVERIKKEVPVWGKEILNDNKHIWKENK